MIGAFAAGSRAIRSRWTRLGCDGSWARGASSRRRRILAAARTRPDAHPTRPPMIARIPLRRLRSCHSFGDEREAARPRRVVFVVVCSPRCCHHSPSLNCPAADGGSTRGRAGAAYGAAERGAACFRRGAKRGCADSPAAFLFHAAGAAHTCLRRSTGVCVKGARTAEPCARTHRRGSRTPMTTVRTTTAAGRRSAAFVQPRDYDARPGLTRISGDRRSRERGQRSGDCASPRSRAGVLAAAAVACLPLLVFRRGRGAKAPRARRSLPRLHSSVSPPKLGHGRRRSGKGQRAQPARVLARQPTTNGATLPTRLWLSMFSAGVRGQRPPAAAFCAACLPSRWQSAMRRSCTGVAGRPRRR
jgi:hypothetical protein